MKTSRVSSILGALAFACALSACGQGDSSTHESGSGSVLVDGSSTVYPMSETAYQLMSGERPDIYVSAKSSGTGGGFQRFCSGETDVSNASRPIDPDEAAECARNDVSYTELHVAVDAITVTVHPDLGVDCLTTDQLSQLWRPDSQVRRWNQLDPRFPDREIKLYGPGTDSGTYDYFAEEVVQDGNGATRADYVSSEDDNVLAQGVASTRGATGYFGYTYFERYIDSLKAVAINDGHGCVTPTPESARTGAFEPLSRPLYIYVSNAKYEERASVRAYVDFYIANLPAIVDAAQFISLDAQQYAKTQAVLAQVRSAAGD